MTVRESGTGLDIDDALLADCIHCGLCLETCPTFVETGREEESPRGRLLLMQGLRTGRWGPDPSVLDHLDLCLGCRACETACPSGVQYGRVLEETRSRLATRRARPRSGLERRLIRHVLWRGALLERLARAYRRLGVQAALRGLGRLMPSSSTWRRRLALAPRAEEPMNRAPSPAACGGPTAILLRGCVARAFYPATESASVTLLQRAGYSVLAVSEPPCCGALAAHAGEPDLARRFAGEILDRVPADGLVIPTAAGCGAHLQGLEHHVGPGTDADRAAALGARVRDLGEALLEGPRELRFATDRVPGVVYQDACHLLHGQGVREVPRKLLRRSGAELLEIAEAELCCGSAGTYNLARPVMAERLGKRKASRILRAGAGVVVTANPGCRVQLEAELPPEVRVTSLARFLADRLRD